MRNSEYSIITVATKYNKKASALSYLIRKSKNEEIAEEAEKAWQTTNQVFSAKLEEELRHYILMSVESYVGLDPQNIRILAYDLALANNLKVPLNWLKKTNVGPD